MRWQHLSGWPESDASYGFDRLSIILMMKNNMIAIKK
jgi:hypothetical protein